MDSKHPTPTHLKARTLALGLGAATLVAAALVFDEASAKSVARPQPGDERPALVQTQDRPVIEVTFVLDTTGSMGGLLEGAKQKIWSIASRIASGQPTPRVRVGLVAFRDIGDEYVTKVFPLTDDLDQVYENLRGFQPDGGGDTPEHVGRGLGEAVSKLQWSQDSKVMKMIFVVGDAPPQQYQDGWDYRKWAKAAEKKGIVVNAVQCGSDQSTRIAFSELASLGGGTFAAIDSSGGMIAVRTPFDDKIAELTNRISGLSLYAGGRAARRAAESKRMEMASMAPEAAADRLGYLSKAKGGEGSGAVAAAAAPAAPGTRDLLADGDALDHAEAEELPDELRGMDKAAQKAEVARRSKERTELEKQVVELAKKRDAWLASNASEKEDSFDAQVMKDVKKRAKTYGIAY